MAIVPMLCTSWAMLHCLLHQKHLLNLLNLLNQILHWSCHACKLLFHHYFYALVFFKHSNVKHQLAIWPVSQVCKKLWGKLWICIHAVAYLLQRIFMVAFVQIHMKIDPFTFLSHGNRSYDGELVGLGDLKPGTHLRAASVAC